MMKEGDVILTPVPQADGTIKTRPAVILREMPYNDFLVCGVSTQLHQLVKDFDEVISHFRPGFHVNRFEIRIIGEARISGCTAQ